MSQLKNILEILNGDITTVYCDAIVNAANSHLAGGGGVDGAIHRVAGPQLLKKCQEIIKEIKYLNPGEAVITPSYNMNNVKYIIHTVGPVWRGGKYGEDEILSRCYMNSLKLARENNIRTIAFPAISTGVYGYPWEEALNVYFSTIKKEQNIDFFEKIFFVFFEKDFYMLADKKFNLYFG